MPPNHRVVLDKTGSQPKENKKKNNVKEYSCQLLFNTFKCRKLSQSVLWVVGILPKGNRTLRDE